MDPHTTWCMADSITGSQGDYLGMALEHWATLLSCFHSMTLGFVIPLCVITTPEFFCSLQNLRVHFPRSVDARDHSGISLQWAGLPHGQL